MKSSPGESSSNHPPLQVASQSQGRRAVWLATGLGVGMVVGAPGTIGGLWGVPLAWGLGELNDAWAQAAVLAVLVGLAMAACHRAAAALGSSDPSAVVLDEIVALPVVFLGHGRLDWSTLVVGFLLFRLFDIVKPGPVRTAERLPGGVGIVMDDLVAALLAWAGLAAMGWLDAYAGWGWLS